MNHKALAIAPIVAVAALVLTAVEFAISQQAFAGQPLWMRCQLLSVSCLLPRQQDIHFSADQSGQYLYKGNLCQRSREPSKYIWIRICSLNLIQKKRHAFPPLFFEI